MIFIIIFLALFLLYTILPREEVVIKIKKGMTASEIADLLHKNGVIWSKHFFLGLFYLTNDLNRIKYGVYRLEKNMNPLKLREKLITGKTEFVKLTIPEGLTDEEISGLLEKKGVCDWKEFLNEVKKRKLTGYLFPDTYFLYTGMRANEVIEILLENYRRKTEKIFQNYTSHLTPYQCLILASIIEKEASDMKERRIISGIFHKRLKRKLPLQSCATIRYVLKDYNKKLTYKDLRVKSPYNTYINLGLPPAPICNPGISSIIAALHPLETDYLFFLADGKGKHIFSKTKEEHLLKQKRRK